MSWFCVRVPASSANLGPGFDALGLALGVYLECRFRRAGALAISVAGRHATGIPTGEDNLIWRTACAVADNQALPLPAIELEIVNDIPLGKGLGSSAAALTAGVVIADNLLGFGLETAAHSGRGRAPGRPPGQRGSVYGSAPSWPAPSIAAGWRGPSGLTCLRASAWPSWCPISTCPR